MRIYFNVIGGLLFLVALYFGYWALQAGSALRGVLSGPDSGLAAGVAMSIASAYLQIALLAIIGSGVFSGVAEIMRAIDRASHRGVAADEQDSLSQGAF